MKFTAAHLSQSITPWTLCKNPSLPLVFELTLFQSYPKIYDHRWRSEKKRFQKWQLCGVWKLPFYDRRAIKHTQNCLCLTNSRINLPVPSSVTREYHPKVLEVLHLLQCIAASLQHALDWFSGEVYTSVVLVVSDTHFLVVSDKSKTDKMHVDPVREDASSTKSYANS